MKKRIKKYRVSKWERIERFLFHTFVITMVTVILIASAVEFLNLCKMVINIISNIF